jgi:N-acetylglucosamine malate deacetylase 1
MSFDIVVFAAHPDDAELFCGGTLVKMVKKGYSAAIVDLTAGEMGTRGTPEIRAREADCARTVLGVGHRENAGIRDTEVIVSLENRNRLIEIIRRLKPRMVITSYGEGRHPDHCAASRLVYDACFFSGLKNYPLDGDATRPHKILYAVRHKEYVPPSFIIDISEELDTKLESLRCYGSQFPDRSGEQPGHPATNPVFERIRTFASFCGTLIGKKYGEAFFTKEAMEIDDPLKLTVPSI